MGEHKVTAAQEAEQLRLFTRALLRDLRALESMLDEGLFETDVQRVGAEQEMFLVDENWRPALIADEILQDLGDSHFTNELGRFNLECNLDPIDLQPAALSLMEEQLNLLLSKVRTVANKHGTKVVLVGILPTLDKSDLTLENMTPRPRYFTLNEAAKRLRGERFRLYLKGRDELNVTHDNVMLEACNTSFQVHFQVQPQDFARLYNVAQAIAAPVIAAANNSPFLFGKQLWRETRIAVFQQSVDTRAPSGNTREQAPRVSFGRRWIDDSVVEIFKEDISRFRVLMTREIGEDPFETLAGGKTPKLHALRLHNGTVYRWNRPCYGISNGKPHLRIENRVLPSGPTVVDEVANAAFWFGLLKGVSVEYGDITQKMDFAFARENFVAACRLGLGAQLTWPGHEHVTAQELLLKEMAPLARKGLSDLHIDRADIDRYIGIIEERIRTRRTGSQWMIDSFDSIKCDSTLSECLGVLTAATVNRQETGKPVHTWALASKPEAGTGPQHHLRIGQLMTTDIFTVNQDELVDIVACVMHWHHVRHVPVEDDQHHLVGLVTHRSLLRLLADNANEKNHQPVPVSRIMTRDIVTVDPSTPTLEAIRIMKRKKISCLPVVDSRDRLVGIVSERDFMAIAGHLLEDFLS
ncbi:MAG: CBS domain-containing protein [Acidobacteriota bacterium]